MKSRKASKGSKSYCELKYEHKHRFVLGIVNLPVTFSTDLVPEHMRIGKNAPNQKVPLARLDFF